VPPPTVKFVSPGQVNGAGVSLVILTAPDHRTDNTLGSRVFKSRRLH
jgi:hypothetical protein